MSNLLREVLRTLCGVNQWSYAVFWKIGCHNPKLLIWEECYLGPASSSVLPQNSVAENSDLSVSDRQQYWGSDVHSPFGIQARDRVHLLINKMLISNQVNIVGEGLVGRAAFTGNHEWILASRYNGGVHPPEVSNEVHHQFSAGIQTVAVVPIFPHGVVQFGSLSLIMENLGFVNNVKSLTLQLGCVPGVLRSDNYSARECAERIGLPISLGMPIPMHLMNSTPLLVDNCSQLSFLSPTSRSIGQPSHSQCKQTRDNAQLAVSASHIPNMTHNLAKSHDGHSAMESIALMKPGDLSKGNLQNGFVGAQVMPSKPHLFLNQHAASQDSRPGFSHRPIISQSDGNNSISKLLQQQIALDAAVQNHVCDNEDALQRFTRPHMRTNGNPHLSEGSLTSGTELLNRISDHTRLSSIPCSIPNPQNMEDVTSFSAHPARLGHQSFLSSRAEEVPLSTLGHQLSGSGMLSGSLDNKNIYSDMKHSENEFTARKERMDSDPFEAFNNKLSSQPDECVTLAEHSPSYLHDCLHYESGICGTITADAKYEGSLAQPLSGDDLYDVLGMDFKNKLLSGKWNNVLEDGPYAKMQVTGKDMSTFKNMQAVNPDVYSVNEESGIFSATDTDNLLDAVVSGAYSAPKQSFDDNISCSTTLMKTDSSSFPSDSLAHGLVNVSDQPRTGLFELPKLWEKAGAEASSSLISGCMKDGVKSCSQSTSLYGSQLSSWVEQAHNVRCESTAVTAFSKKNDEVSKPNRKRLKPGENPRPRPKDRQMIQDRVKELREIVPNGAKCSIDALLERTIKHMLFLQSVTKHADKLKQTGESKIINKDGGVLLKDNFEGGATWAYKVGSQSLVCPIIVEDLNPPRQMLVEMLCEEYGCFLEIADLIRGLGLTILKGMMEAQNDKIRARFAVEANRDVTRMEIFVSLVRLLEQTMKGSPSAVNALEKNSMIHLAFPQTASMPATGRRSNLQ